MFDCPQWILVRLEKNPSNPDKLIKKPIHPKTKVVSDALNPSIWVSFEEAKKLAGNKYAIAFVLTENDPYFCIDIDSCLINNDWSPLAKKLCKQFNGAYIEVSVSGKALHIWGKASHIPPHKKKNVKLNLEMYDSKRFIVLGSHGQGNPETDFTTTLGKFIDEYLRPSAKDLTNSPDVEFTWTTAPVDEWSGPEDDDKLLELAYTSRSNAVVFGGRVSFKDLFEANPRPLQERWPADNDKGYDASSADAALAQHLAYWTGKNCERVKRLMLRSKLVRGKWKNREDYLTRTILNACSLQQRVYNDGKTTRPDKISKRMAGGFVAPEDMPEVFKDCIYITSLNKALVPGCKLVDSATFNVLYGGYKFMLDDQKTTRKAWEAFTESATFRPPIAEYAAFMPDQKPMALVELGGDLVANTWMPPRIEEVDGNVDKFLTLVHTTLPNGDDATILLSYMAAILQYPGVKFTWAPLIQGPKGSGKGFFISCITEVLPPRYFSKPNSESLVSKNNGWVDGCLFAGVDEFRIHSFKDFDTVKTLITDKRINIEDKYVKQFTGLNYVNFIFATNYIDAVPIEANERRLAPLAQAQQTSAELERAGLTPEFFADLYDWANATGKYYGQPKGWNMIAKYLLDYEIPAKYNPATTCPRAPKTSSWELFVANSAGLIEQEILELVAQQYPGFAGDWISSIALDKFLTRRKLANKLSHRAREDMLRRLGYVPHPNLKGGRATCAVLPDGGRPRLFIKEGSPAGLIKRPLEICKAYERAQRSDVIEAGGATLVSLK